ncbi:MAG TPA: bifunctional lysylphosphatidylglycerol flippase/synthetase MprF [Candidatus Binatia bacterium]|nr:bifunctional lysylphosphatidylglycerol flippase/synthetase MprF [Candidatus Binatia bacterium]
MKQKFLHSLGPLFGLLLFVVALWVLHHELQEYHYHDVVRHMEKLSAQRLFRALVLTIASYVVLTGYDTLSLRYVHRPLAYGKIALASFIGYAFSHNIGFSLLSGGSVRYRFYSAWGLSAVEITTVVVFNGLTFWFGILTLGGVIFLWEPLVIPSSLQLPFTSVCPLGMVFLLLVGGYLFCSAFRKTPLQIREWKIPLPPLWLAFSQVALSSLDWALAGSVLYVLLPDTATLSYPGFLGIFILAQITGVVSQVPGGLGVFETVVLLLLSPQFPTLSILGALVAYRGIYYLLPLGVASVLLGAHELLEKKKEVRWLAGLFGQWGPAVVPQLLAFITFIGGAILLFSGATPAIYSRLTWLKDFLPLPVIELSHFLSSLAGVGLLLLARSLQQRLDAAYHMTVLLLSAGIVFSLLKGFDYEEAITLSGMLVALLPCRRHFYRKASLFGERFTPRWIAAIAMVLLGSVWLGMFSYKHVEYSHELWWRFALSDDAPRFLRATVGAISAVLIFAMARLLRPALLEIGLPGPAELDKARTVVAQSCNTSANLALLGDKALLFSNNGSAFIMYGVEGRSWVALGDPVGPREEITELVWQYRELCNRHGGWTVFYKVGVEHLPLYLDLGLALLKIGEEARVRLATFSLKGEARKGLRYVCNKLEKEDCTFTTTPAERIPALLPELKVISDAWLAEKHTREKGFSLGRFNPEYLKQFPAGVVRQADRIVAFANLWLSAEKEELSLDLMRYLPEAPPDVMEYLIIRLMLWGKQEGYRWFNLGMAPFSGLENRTLAPLWHRLGTFVFHHGEHFYNFQGLRQYKEKFDPVWEPKYLASPDGLALPRILTNLASLIAGGLKEIVTK